MSLTRILVLPRGPAEPANFIVADAAGMIVTSGALRPGAPAPKMRTLVVVPGEEVLVRWIALKAASADQGRAAAAMMLQDELAQPRVALHFALGEGNGAGLRPVCVMDKAALAARLDQARRLGAAPDAVVPDCLMLPPPEGEGLIAAAMGELVAVRGAGVAFTAETALADQLIAGRPAEHVSDPARIAGLFAAAAAHGAPVDLLQGEFGRGSGKPGGWGLAAAFAGAVLLSPLLIEGAHIWRDEMAGRQLTPMASKGSETFRREVASVQQGREFGAEMAAVLGALERLPGARLQSLSYRAGGAMRLTLLHDNYSDVATLAGALGPAGLGVREDGSSEAGGRISTDLTLTRAK